MIGSIFGITESRVTYFGPMMSIYSLVLGLLSGTALFLLYSMIFHRVTGDGDVERQISLYNEFTIIFAYVAGIAVVFLMKANIFSSISKDQKGGEKVYRQYYTKNLGKEMAEDIFSAS